MKLFRLASFLFSTVLILSCAKPFSLAAVQIQLNVQDDAGRPLSDYLVLWHSPHPCARELHFERQFTYEEFLEKQARVRTDADGRATLKLGAREGSCGFPSANPRFWLYSDSVLPDQLRADVFVYVNFPKDKTSLFQFVGVRGFDLTPMEAIRLPDSRSFEAVSFETAKRESGELASWQVTVRIRPAA